MDTKWYADSTAVAGVMLVLLGIVFFAVTQGVFNVSWGNIWPVFPMLAGVFLLGLAFTQPNNATRSGLVFAGTIPFLIGIFFFLTTTGILDTRARGDLWPVYPLIVGVAFLGAYFASNMQQRYYLFPAAILFAVGGVFLILKLTDTSYSYIGKLWPLALIILGVAMLFPRLRRVERAE
jgi:steroid 5-alpha reductase family enzyme